jgi:hypothetical protein
VSTFDEPLGQSHFVFRICHAASFLIIPAALPDRGVHFSFIAQKFRPGGMLAAETGVWF